MTEHKRIKKEQGASSKREDAQPTISPAQEEAATENIDAGIQQKQDAIDEILGDYVAPPEGTQIIGAPKARAERIDQSAEEFVTGFVQPKGQ